MTDDIDVTVAEQKQLLAYVQGMFPPDLANHQDRQMSALARVLCAIAMSRGIHIENLKAHFETIYGGTNVSSTASH